MINVLKQSQSQAPQLDVEYKKIYARSFGNAQLKNINNSGAYLFLQNPNKQKSQEQQDLQKQINDLSEDKNHKQDSLHLKDKISIVLEVGERKRTLQASVVSTDSYGARVKFHFYNNRDYQIVDDLIYFVEKSKEERRRRLDFIFDQTF